jgi:hypothetical protein
MLQGFKSGLVGGGARPNQFVVETLGKGGNGEFHCKATSLPGATTGVASVFYRGREVKFAGDRTYQPWTVTILNDITFGIHRSLFDWAAQMNEESEVGGDIFPQSYWDTLIVKHLDKNGTPLRTFMLKDAFPMEVGEVSLDWGDNDRVEEFTCTFAFNDYSQM